MSGVALAAAALRGGCVPRWLGDQPREQYVDSRIRRIQQGERAGHSERCEAGLGQIDSASLRGVRCSC
jgi:hypothetical protein